MYEGTKAAVLARSRGPDQLQCPAEPVTGRTLPCSRGGLYKVNLRAPGLSKEARGACGAVGGALFPGGGELAVRGGGWWGALEGGPELGAVTDIGDQVWILGLWYGSVLSHGMSHNATPSINTSSQTKALVQCWSQLQPTKVNFSCEPNF